MAKKKEAIAIVPTKVGVPDFTDVLQSQDISIADKRKHVLEGLGLKGKRRKYKSPEERKEAAKKRKEERKAERDKTLEGYGLLPRVKGPKLTKEQRKVKRSVRSKERRSFMRDMAKQNPDLAKTYGIDVGRFKL